ncbi:MAG: hypothetical protein V1885_03045 [Candidatus Brennerbacteria bacterium]
MLLYHGSKHRLEDIEARQAQTAGDIEVPEGELLNAIYLTPDYGFAVACAVRPSGKTEIDREEKTIEFEHPELFDPESSIYIHKFDSSKIPAEHLKQIDDHQFAVEGLTELKPDSVEELKARGVERFFKLTNWESGENAREAQNETRQKFG